MSALLRIASNHDGSFYCLKCFYSFRTKNELKKHENICNNHDYCYVEIPDKYNNISKYNSGEKYMRVPFIMYVDMKCLLETVSTCRNNPNESSTTKINKHTNSGYSLLTYCSFDYTKIKLSHYRVQDSMKMVSKDLKERAKRIIYCKKKK